MRLLAPRAKPPAALGSEAQDLELLADKAYRLIKTQILGGKFPPNTPLPEAELQRSLEMGRTPIREALIRLQQEGLVQIVPRRGAFVQTLTLNDARDLYHVRSILEPEAVRLASRHISPGELEALAKEFRELLADEDAIDLEELIQLDQKLHRLFLERCGNPYLAEALERLHNHSQLAWALSAQNRAEMLQACKNHLALIESLQQGDVEKAAGMMREHVLAMYRAISTLTR